MKILFIVRNEIIPTSGGVERVTSILTEVLKKKEQSVHIIYTGITGILDKKRHCGINFAFLPTPDSISDISNFEFIRDYIVHNGIEIVINQNTNPNIAHYLRKITGYDFRVISCIHTPLLTPEILFDYHLASAYKVGPVQRLKTVVKMAARNRLGRKYFNNYIRDLSIIFQSSDVCVVPSIYQIAEYRTLLGENVDCDIIALSHPLTFPTQDIDMTLAGKANIVLAVSRLERASKRIDLLLRAWSDVSHKYPDWQLVIVGGGGHNSTNDPQERELLLLKRLSRKLDLKNVVFPGRQDPLEFYKSASIFALTSASEAWGMSLVEAQQFGCAPVVFRSFSALDEIVTHEVNGLSVPFGEVGEFAKAIKSLIDDPKMRERIARNAARSTHRFCSKTIADKWLQLFEDLKNQRS